jgi:hypothetical protein
MRGAIHPLPNTPSWHGAWVKHRDNFTFIVSFLLCEKDLKREPNRTLQNVDSESGR